MLFILVLVVVMALIIGFCMAMEKLDESKGRYLYTYTKEITYTHDESDNEYMLDPFDPANPYNDCPNCGSGDTDGNHCYDCDEDF